MELAFMDICIFALTWLDEMVSDVEVSLNNFMIIRSDRKRQSGMMKVAGSAFTSITGDVATSRCVSPTWRC